MDVVWYRKNPPLDRRRVATLIGYHLLPFTFNEFGGLLRAADKRSILDFPELTPRSRIAANVEELRACAGEFTGKVVVKPLDGFGGWGVELHDAGKLATARADGPFPVMVQEYLPEVATEGDVRILTLYGEIIGAMRRVPRPGEFRANVAQGERSPGMNPPERTGGLRDNGGIVPGAGPAFCRSGLRGRQADRDKLRQPRRHPAHKSSGRERASRARA